MKENKIKKLVEMGMSSFKDGYFNQEIFLKKLEKSGYESDITSQRVASHITAHERQSRPCIFIEGNEDLGIDPCDFYRKLELNDPHRTICEGRWTADQRWNGGGPYHDSNGEMIGEKIPSPCQGPYQTKFVKILQEAISRYEKLFKQ